jgi:hypothetical protein
MPNGTYKTTSSGRLQDLNEVVNLHVSRNRRIRVYDAAVSSGITSAEWFTTLRSAGLDVEMYAGDAFLNATLVRFIPGLTILATPTGYLLQFEFFGRCFSSRPTKLAKLVVYTIGNWLLTRLFRFRRLLPIRWFIREERNVVLLSRAAANLPIEFVEEDLTAHPLRDIGKMDVIRVANLLNHDYFDEMTMSSIVKMLRSRLSDGGLFAVGSTDDYGTNHATVFRAGSDRPIVLARLGSGAPVEDLVARSL